MSSSFGSWCSWTKQEDWVNRRFYLFISCVNQVEWEREMRHPGVWELPLKLTQARWHNLVRVECFRVCFAWLLFYWVLMLLWVVSVGFDNTCTLSGKWNVSKVIPRFSGWVYKTLRLFPLVVKHSVEVMSVRLNPMGSQFSIPVVWNLCSESVVA